MGNGVYTFTGMWHVPNNCYYHMVVPTQEASKPLSLQSVSHQVTLTLFTAFPIIGSAPQSQRLL